MAASRNNRDIESQRSASETMDAYLTRTCDAICKAHTAWRQRVKLSNVTINGVTATGGALGGPGMGPDIRQYAPKENSWQRPRSEAIATGIGACWENWQRSVSVPGLPWYPAFVAVPSPVAPPTPNVPTPLLALRQLVTHLTWPQLKAEMLANYHGDNEWPHQLFEAVAFAFEQTFQLWAPLQPICNVLGTGPVPTFAPPYVPVGPVVGGTGNQAPYAW